jgi:hypothetical protein
VGVFVSDRIAARPAFHLCDVGLAPVRAGRRSLRSAETANESIDW